MDIQYQDTKVDSATPLIDKTEAKEDRAVDSSVRSLKIWLRSRIVIGICIACSVLLSTNLWGRLRDLDTLNSCLADQHVLFVTQASRDWKEATWTWNDRVQFKPLAVAVPKSVEEIQAAVLCGIKHNLHVSAKGGGHSFASNGIGGEDGHLVVDLQHMHNVTVHDNYTASIQPGARLGHVSIELHKQARRAIPHGACPGVGIAGHVLYGGYGRASRTHGLTLDWLVGARVVLGDGTMVYCSATENEDLFWALRGAGPSFGIVVDFEFKTFEAPERVTPFTIELPWSEERAIAALSAVQDLAMTASQELNLFLFVTTTSQVIQGLYFGGEDGLLEVLQPLLTHLETSVSFMRTCGWLEGLEAYADGVDLDQTLPYNEHGIFYTSSLTTPLLTAGQLESLASTMFANIRNTSARHTWDIFFEMHGGPMSAVSQMDTSATAYPHRDKVLLWQLSDWVEAGHYPKEGFAVLRQLTDSVTQLMEDKDWGMYANFLDTQRDTKTAQAKYWGDNLPRLRQIKSAMDPKNVFWSPQGFISGQA